MKKQILTLISFYSFLSVILFLVLLFYTFTDNNFYEGYIKSFNNNEALIVYKLISLKVVPLFSFLIFLLFVRRKINLKLFQYIGMAILSVVIFLLFDFRDLLIFIDNHRIKLYISLVVCLVFMIITLKELIIPR